MQLHDRPATSGYRRPIQDLLDAIPAHAAIVEHSGNILATNGLWQASTTRRHCEPWRPGAGENLLAALDERAPHAPAVAAAGGLREVLRGDAEHLSLSYACDLHEEPRSYELLASRLPNGRALVMHVDVTESRRALEDIARSDALFRAAFEHALDAFVIFDSEGRYLHLNPAARELVAISPGETREYRIADLAEPAQHEAMDRFIREFLEAGVARGEGRILGADGAWREVDYTARSHIVPGHHLAVIRDVTESRQLEAQLQQAQKMEAVGQLTGGIAHDFNNLLTIVLASAEMARAMTRPDEPALLADLDQIVGAAQRGADLVRKLLAFSRREKLERRPLCAGATLREIVPMLNRLIPENILVELTVEGTLPAVDADLGAVQQILLNLATNARDAMPGGGRLHLHASTVRGARVPLLAASGAMGRFVAIRVSDTGRGMDAATRDRIFEPFFTTKDPGLGTGLGMSMVYGLTRQHGGYVDVESERGSGTSVTVYFPATEAETTSAGHADASVPRGLPGGSERLLLVEDDDAILAAAQRVLQRAGYEVVTATDGVAASAVLHTPGERFDLVISDFVMPRAGGDRVLDAVRDLAEPPPVLFVSGYGLDPSAIERQGQTYLLTKPWRPAELRAAVRAALDARPAPRNDR